SMRLPAASAVAVSIVLPAKDEAASLGSLIPALRRILPHAEIIVVDDGSKDSTAEVARKLGARVISHPYCLGNGASIKTGIRAARSEYVVFMDADGQHNPTDIPNLLSLLENGYDMVVGSRSATSQANIS